MARTDFYPDWKKMSISTPLTYRMAAMENRPKQTAHLVISLHVSDDGNTYSDIKHHQTKHTPRWHSLTDALLRVPAVQCSATQCMHALAGLHD